MRVLDSFEWGSMACWNHPILGSCWFDYYCMIEKLWFQHLYPLCNSCIVDRLFQQEIYGLLFLIVQQFFCIPMSLVIEDFLWIMVKDCVENPILFGYFAAAFLRISACESLASDSANEKLWYRVLWVKRIALALPCFLVFEKSHLHMWSTHRTWSVWCLSSAFPDDDAFSWGPFLRGWCLSFPVLVVWNVLFPALFSFLLNCCSVL